MTAATVGLMASKVNVTPGVGADTFPVLSVALALITFAPGARVAL